MRIGMNTERQNKTLAYFYLLVIFVISLVLLMESHSG